MAEIYVATPPRMVPVTTRIKVLFGKILVQVGFGTMLFSSIFFWIFGTLSNFGGLFIPSPDSKADGTITAITATNTEVNDRFVKKNTASFVASDGNTYAVDGYTDVEELQVGDKVAVAYPAANPAAGKIVGQRTGSMPGWVLWIVAPIPIVGILLLLFGFYAGLKSIRLLAWGEYATGRLLSKVATNVTINDMPVMKLTYEVKLPGGRTFQATAESHHAEKFEDGKDEPLLYEQNASGGYNAVILDAMPGKTQFDNQGNVQAAPIAEVVWVLVLPELFTVTNAIVAYLVYGS